MNECVHGNTLNFYIFHNFPIITFAFILLADAFIQSDLEIRCIQITVDQGESFESSSYCMPFIVAASILWP